MPVTLQRTRREGDNDDRAFEQTLVAQPIILYQLILGFPMFAQSVVGRLVAPAAEDANVVDSFQSPDLFGCL